MPRGVDRGDRQGHHAAAAGGPVRARCISSPTAAKRSRRLIVVLQGDGVRVDLTGATFISKAGITLSTFKTVPDVPVQHVRALPPRGQVLRAGSQRQPLQAASGLKMPTEFVAQNGAVINQSTKITVTGCPNGKSSQDTKQNRKGQSQESQHRTGGPTDEATTHLKHTAPPHTLTAIIMTLAVAAGARRSRPRPSSSLRTFRRVTWREVTQKPGPP